MSLEYAVKTIQIINMDSFNYVYKSTMQSRKQQSIADFNYTLPT